MDDFNHFILLHEKKKEMIKDYIASWRPWILALVGILFFASCSKKPPLAGRLIPHNEWKPIVYLVQPRSLDEICSAYMGTVIDSAKIHADGSFAFAAMPMVDQPQLLELVVQKNGERFSNRMENDDPLQSNYMPFVWEGTRPLYFTGEIDALQKTCQLKAPTSLNQALLSLRDLRIDAFVRHLQPLSADHNEATMLEHEAGLLAYQRDLIDFAEKTNLLIPAMVAFRWTSPNGDYERIPEFVFDQCQKWKMKEDKNDWVAQLCQKADKSSLPILTGDILPDVPLPMASGDTTSLHQLIFSRLTLVDLWASWCMPCRRENKQILAPLWEKHHSEGFQIIGYALDADEKAWKNAMKNDGVDLWPQASHLSGDSSPIMDAFNIQTIPANYLIDAEGQVIAKNLHGAQLVTFVEKVLSE